MIRRIFVYSPAAREDLFALYDRIAAVTSHNVARAYGLRLRDNIEGFDLASKRGTPRDDIRRGLRTVGFERRVTIAFRVQAERVLILRVFYGGQDWEAALREL